MAPRFCARCARCECSRAGVATAFLRRVPGPVHKLARETARGQQGASGRDLASKRYRDIAY
jgi:hypothetical protein